MDFMLEYWSELDCRSRRSGGQWLATLKHYLIRHIVPPLEFKEFRIRERNSTTFTWRDYQQSSKEVPNKAADNYSGDFYP